MAIDLPPAAPPASVSATLTETEVRVTSGFTGAKISVYGAVFDPAGKPSDVVVVVRGPTQPVRIARKVRVSGIWLNSRPSMGSDIPG